MGPSRNGTGRGRPVFFVESGVEESPYGKGINCLTKGASQK